MSFDVLQEKIREKANPTVAGLDARVEYVPPHILKKHTDRLGETLEAAAETICEFDCGLIDALYDVVPAVKPQAAYFEMLGWRGMKVMEDVMAYAKNKGLYVIADIKRGDIGTTATAYAEGWLGATQVGSASLSAFDADCVTLNGYMGSDAINPFLNECVARGKSAFVLAKTSNPSSAELQDMVAGDRSVYTVMGDLIEQWGKGTEGACGYQALGAVVGATHPSVLRELRLRLPKTFFLVPGYGAQGGTAEDVRNAFDELGRGAIINASRSIMCAWKKTGKDGADYQEAARAAAEKMRDELKEFITVR